MLSKTKLNSIGASISRVLINSYISHDESLLVYNVLREYDDMIEDTKNLKTSRAN